MARWDGDGDPGAARGPGEEPEPSESWIIGDAGSSPGEPHGRPRPPNGRGPGEGGPGERGPGEPGRGGHGPGSRWIALAAGFLVLVAVIAVQHFASGDGSAAVSSPDFSSPTATTSAIGSSTRTTSGASMTPSPSASSPPLSSTPPSFRTEGAGSEASAVTASAATGIQTTTAPAPTTIHDTIGATPPEFTATSGPPRTTSVPTQALPGAGDWELVGYGTGHVVRYRPATGLVTVTPVPHLDGNEPPQFVTLTSSVVVRSLRTPGGFVVPDGKPATDLHGVLATFPRQMPGPGSRRLWVVVSQRDPPSLMLVDTDGTRTGTTMPIPTMLGLSPMYSLQPDGAGYVLASGVGGTYDLRPGNVRLITHGLVLATGPAGDLVYDCDDQARCALSIVDQTSGQRHRLSATHLDPEELLNSWGVVSPNGRYAAVIEHGGPSAQLLLINLHSGTARTILALASPTNGAPSTNRMAFTPDGRDLLLARGAVNVVDTRTGDLLSPLPIPPVTQIAIRPGH